MRLKLQQYILKLHQEYKLTTILVSHNIPEVLTMSDQIIELDHGQVIRKGTPSELFTREPEGFVVAVSKQDEAFLVTLLINDQPVKVKIQKSDLT